MTRYRTRYANFGSVSSGTMNTQDLLSALSSELEYQLGRQSRRFPRRALRSLIRSAERTLNDAADSDSDSACSDDTVQELFDALEQFAPPYAYFGAVEGDGANYGYWLSSNMAIDFDGLKVSDTSEVPSGYRGEVLHVNDHGNMTLYVVGSHDKLREIWAIV